MPNNSCYECGIDAIASQLEMSRLNFDHVLTCWYKQINYCGDGSDTVFVSVYYFLCFASVHLWTLCTNLISDIAGIRSSLNIPNKKIETNDLTSKFLFWCQCFMAWTSLENDWICHSLPDHNFFRNRPYQKVPVSVWDPHSMHCSHIPLKYFDQTINRGLLTYLSSPLLNYDISLYQFFYRQHEDSIQLQRFQMVLISNQ